MLRESMRLTRRSRSGSHASPRVCLCTSVAADCGYFDRAHLIRDFRAFAGIAPGAYTAVGTGGRNHVRLEG